MEEPNDDEYNKNENDKNLVEAGGAVFEYIEMS